MRTFYLLAGLLLWSATASAQSEYLYRVTLVRAAPGAYAELRTQYTEHHAAYPDEAPFWMRHSQGDQWDFMLMYPMESFAAFYHPDAVAARPAHADFETTRLARTAKQEDLYVQGPPPAVLQAACGEASMFHVEMFEALPGKHAELYHQREMENAYLAALNRPQNLIFSKVSGASVDAFTLGCYRDLKHFAESVDIPLEDEDRAAKAAGFESVYTISPYLRSLIRAHHDTIAVAVR